MPGRVLRYGREAALIETGSLAEVLALHAELLASPPGGMIETVPAARTLLVRFDPAVTTFASLADDLNSRTRADVQAVAGELVEVPVRYDGPDLEDVTALTGLSRAEVIDRHAGGDYTVALIGLAPGFYFLAGLDPSLHLPRRPSPRAVVPKGAIGLAGEFSGIYPRTGPGGWQLIGHTDASLWDLSTHPSARLEPGTRIRFVVA